MKYTMQNGKALLIVSGGSIDINFSKEYIKDAGNCINGELYMCSVDINQGNSGNIDKGKLFHPKNNRRIGFINVSVANGHIQTVIN